MSNPYRTAPLATTKDVSKQRKTFFGWLRRQYRKFLIKRYGKFSERFRVKCPICNKQSWDPFFMRNFVQFYYKEPKKLEAYRCGHKGILHLRVINNEIKDEIYKLKQCYSKENLL